MDASYVIGIPGVVRPHHLKREKTLVTLKRVSFQKRFMMTVYRRQGCRQKSPAESVTNCSHTNILSLLLNCDVNFLVMFSYTCIVNKIVIEVTVCAKIFFQACKM